MSGGAELLRDAELLREALARVIRVGEALQDGELAAAILDNLAHDVGWKSTRSRRRSTRRT